MKRLLIKLKRTLLYHKINKYVYLLTLGVVIFLYMIFNFSILMLIIFIMYLGLLIYNSWYFLIILLLLLFVITINLVVQRKIYNSVPYEEITMKAQITDIKKNENSYKITIKDNFLNYIFYEKKDLYHIGDVILISGCLTKAEEAPSPNLFDYQKYLKMNNIKGIIKNPTVKIINNQFTIAKINNYFRNYFKMHFDAISGGYLEALIIGYKDNIDDKSLSNIREIGISHLFVISGLHMGIIILVLKKILTLLRINNTIQFYIIIVFFVAYYIITLCSISILRVIVVYILTRICTKYHLNITTLNIYALSIILILLFKPYYLFSYAFLLTYLSSISLVIISPLLKYKGIKGFIINNLLISCNSILVTLPIVISINPEINLLSIIYNLLYIPFVTYIMLPLSFIVAIFYPIGEVYLLLVKSFNIVTSALANIRWFRIIFPSVSVLIIACYYLVYLNIIENSLKKRHKSIGVHVAILVIILLIWSNISLFNINDEIIFMNLPQGEATLICKSFNRANILIDTGENIKEDLELFLMKKGVKRIDYLFISHSDTDHNGKIPILINKFKIRNVVITPYDQKTLQILIKNHYKGHVIMMKKGDIIKYKGIDFKALLPNEDTGKSNNNSLVLKISAFNYKLLLTGDIEKSQEERLINNEKNIKVNFFKIPHHGSNTSSSEKLLNNVSLDYAICMNGYLNTFSFPTSQTIDKYNSQQLLITSTEKTIIFRKKFYNSSLKRWKQKLHFI